MLRSMSNANVEIGARVRVARKAIRMPQAEMGRRLGLAAFPAFESGRRTWTGELVGRVVEIVGGINFADLVPRQNA